MKSTRNNSKQEKNESARKVVHLLNKVRYPWGWGVNAAPLKLQFTEPALDSREMQHPEQENKCGFVNKP